MNVKGFIVPLVIVVVLAVLAGGGVALFVNQSGNETKPITESPETALVGEESEGNDELQPETEIGSMTGTVTDLLKTGQDLTCTFNRADEAGTVAGTVYLANQGQRLRGDFTMNQPNSTELNAHVIRDADFNYFWTDDQEQGTKTPVGEHEDEAASTKSSDQDVLDEKLEYDCDRWSVDASMFSLPSNKEFVDLTEQIQQINQAEDTVKDAQCAACDQVEGPGKAQCLAALGC